MSDSSTNGSGALTDIVAIQQRNIAALAQAQTELVSGMADLFARYQSEAFRALLSASTAFPWANPPRDTPAAITLMFDTLKNATLDSSARSNALSESAALASAGASTTLNSRWLASLDEWKAALIAASSSAAAP